MKYFVQFSSSFGGRLNPVMKHLSKVLPAVGLPYNPHFLEHPTWVSWVKGVVGGQAKFILLASQDDLESFCYDAWKNSKTSVVEVFGSVMDANKGLWEELLSKMVGVDNRVQVWLGGYITDPGRWLENIRLSVGVCWLKSLEELPGYAGQSPDHSLLSEYPALPRLTMSTGCLFNCNFCTIERKVKEVRIDSIFNQVASFMGLKFEYIYLDDKTFGQASNYRLLGLVKQMVLEYNPEFKGFIVQTTVGELYQKYEEFLDLGVVFAEIGVEIPDDIFLKKMNKPYRMAALDRLMRYHTGRVRSYHESIRIIPNILFGVPGDDYEVTLRWLDKHMDVLSHINPFILSFYEEAKNAQGMIGDHTAEDGDDDETKYSRSWLSEYEVRLMEEALDCAFFLVEKHLDVY